MDFLDPKRKKAHRRRLLIGYLLVAVALAMGTWLLLNSASGYWFDRRTGSVIQNGTVFVDSQPGGSNVYLNGVLQGNKTATRMVLPGGHQYTVKLTQGGYRDWSRTFSLDGGKIERLVYPFLVPSALKTSEAQLYASAPALSSESPDRRWLLVQQPGQVYNFDLYDLNNPSYTPSTVTVPQNILTEPSADATLDVVEWSNDNHHVLLERDFNNTHEFIMFDTSNVASSVNINTVLTVSPTEIHLRDKKYDQLFVYDTNGGTVRLGDLKARTISGAILDNVLDFKSYGSDLIIYATHVGAATGKVNFRVREDDKATYLLKSVPDSTHYLIDVSEYNGTPYFALGSSQDDAVFVYRDPLPTLKGQSRSPLFVAAVLRLQNPEFINFSASSQFISAQVGNKIVVYDVDADRQYNVVLAHELSKHYEVKWMDGYRFLFVDKNQSYIVDFDGSNTEQLVPSLADGPYFTPDYKTIVSIAPSKAVSGRFALTKTSLIKK